jgi:hypothetical protein
MIKFILRSLCLCIVLWIVSFSSLTQDEVLACDSNLTIETDIPSELREMASHLLVLDRGSDSWRFIDIQGIESNPKRSDFQIPYFYGNIVLSPTHTLILQEKFTTEGQEQNVVITSLTFDTNDLTIPVDHIVDNRFSPYWLNADTVVLSVQQDTETNRKFDYKLVNIKDQSIREIPVEISAKFGSPFETPDLSPDQSQVVFSPSLGLGREIVIQNIADANDFKVIDRFNWPHAIQWSPVGNSIFVTDDPDNSNAPQRLQIINRNGDKLRSVLLRPNYELPIYDYEFKWSADEKWLLYRDAETQFRGVSEPFPRFLNIETGNVTDICLPGEAFWSPDSRFIAVVVRTSAQENNPSTVVGLFVYDITSDKVYELSITNPNSIGRVLGWANLQE